ncbi:Anti sigma-E protein RseA, N-terminal domain [Thiothrix caldifontis]|uniref:Anti sigma-E protein RseA, N-terminal domain n=1 Tax=Thiothrix caldifontis TaxID=525918 RepID=A0A1H4CLV7_9GAMM|nr:sigma-E factor negative regulatory protein [Thiothrix caldifontis]SEA61298.1 Anti sigma-E protein RseA, N-terminal domain [Thiothrix caldifontis]
MNTSKEEFLSAFLDDESGGFERRRLLDELKKDDALGQTLSRYAFIGETMRASKGQPMGQGVSLLSRIQEELADEPAYEQDNVVAMPAAAKTTATPSRVQAYRWFGMGMAATVAAVAVGGLLFFNQPTTPNAQMAATLPATAPVSATTPTVVADADTRIQQVGRVDPQTRDILKQYVAQHVKYASTTVIAPSIRAVSYAND